MGNSQVACSHICKINLYEEYKINLKTKKDDGGNDGPSSGQKVPKILNYYF